MRQKMLLFRIRSAKVAAILLANKRAVVVWHNMHNA